MILPYKSMIVMFDYGCQPGKPWISWRCILSNLYKNSRNPTCLRVSLTLTGNDNPLSANKNPKHMKSSLKTLKPVKKIIDSEKHQIWTSFFWSSAELMKK